MSSLLVQGQWVFSTAFLVNFVIAIFALVISLVAFVHCVMQRSDAFAAIGTLAKGPWAALLGGATLMSLLGAWQTDAGFIGIFSLLSIVAAAVYLLDVRPGLKDASNGHW